MILKKSLFVSSVLNMCPDIGTFILRLVYIFQIINREFLPRCRTDGLPSHGRCLGVQCVIRRFFSTQLYILSVMYRELDFMVWLN
jgi:hypothetical protein